MNFLSKTKELILRAKKHRKLLMFGGTGLAVLMLPVIARAGSISNFVNQILAFIFEALARLMGFIILMEVKALIQVAQYSNFVAPGPQAVQVGWVVTRDLANMFFILILLVIAFATILSYEEYNYRRLLPRLLIMAVVINFSKTITGIFIDFGQVIMLTFVNGFKDAAAGNFMNAFQVNKLLSLADKGDMTTSGLVLAMILAFIMMATAAAVILVMLIMLLFRVVMLWILIILSPIAFLASTFPAGRSYYTKWWSDLRQYIITGPIIAFFLWLALFIAQASPNGNIAAGEGFSTIPSAGDIELSTQQRNYGIPSEAATSDVLLSMIIITALLFGGLKVAMESGTVGAGFAGAVKGGLAKAGKGIARFGARQAMKPVRDVGGVALSKAGRGLSAITGGRLGTGLAVQGDRLTKGRRAEKQALREKLGGTAVELGKISPSALARRAASAKGAEKVDAMKAMAKNLPAAKEFDKRSDKGKQLDALKKEDFDAYKSVRERFFGDITDKNEQRQVIGSLSGEKLIENSNDKNMALAMEHGNSRAIAELGTNGSAEQKKAMTGFYTDILDRPDGANQFKEHLRDKRMSAADIPAELVAGNTQLGNAVLDAALTDPDAMKKIAGESKMRQAVAPYMSDRINNGIPGADRGRKALQAISTGMMNSDAITEDVQREISQLPVKEIMTFAKNAPTDNKGIQEAVGKALSGAAQFGPSATGQRLSKNPGTSDYVSPEAAAAVNASLPASIDKLGNAVSKAISAAEKTQSDALGRGDTNAADLAATDLTILRTGIDDLNAAAREMKEASGSLNELQGQYSKAQSGGDDEGMKRLADEMKKLSQKMAKQKTTIKVQTSTLNQNMGRA